MMPVKHIMERLFFSLVISSSLEMVLKQTSQLKEFIMKASQDISKQLVTQEQKKEIPMELQLPPIQPLVVPIVQQSTITKQKSEEFIPTPMSLELKRDLFIIQNRHVLDPKRHYKRADKIGPVQVGKIIGGIHDGFLTRKEEKVNILSELLHDTNVKTYMKRKMGEIQVKRNHITRKGYKKKKR
jgi:hypothetical protein